MTNKYFNSPRTGRRAAVWILFVGLAGGIGCSEQNQSAERDSRRTSDQLRLERETHQPRRLDSEQLPNLLRITERVLAGGLPEGEAAFQELADRGVKTIISVDGMTPDVETAEKFGLRYVHLPHGYNGISPQRVQELAKAVHAGSELAGPVYIHCHHGKHRSPAAASVACVSAGLISPAQATTILELAGTNPHYRGLYDAAREARVFDAAFLDELKVDFQEVQPVPPMAEAMVQLDEAFERLEVIAAADWSVPAEHPDLVPAHEAILLREIYTELLRTNEVAEYPDGFQASLRESERAAKALESELAARQSEPATSQPTIRLVELFNQVSENCKSCHVKFRDPPLNSAQDSQR